MARISMRNVQKSTVEEYFTLYLSSAAAKGVKDKTLETYKNHFRSISKRMNTTIPMNRLTSHDFEEMILKMREEGLSASSINSYTRTLKVFFSWCNEEGHSHLNIKLYKAPETVKEVYTDEELMILLKKPEANCNFCEYRNWVIINFLLNSGCRAATVRNIQIQDVDLARKQIVLRHTKNGKVQVIPLCSSMGIVLKVERLPLNIGIGICLGMVPLVAYNYAAKNRERMQSFFSAARLVGLCVAAVSVVLYYFGAPWLIRAFIQEPTTAGYGIQFLQARCFATPFMFLSFHMVHFMQAINRGKISFRLAVIRQLCLNIPILLLMNAMFGISGIIWTQMIADILNVTVSYIIYFRVIRNIR